LLSNEFFLCQNTQKKDRGWGFASDPTWSLQRCPIHPVVFQGRRFAGGWGWGKGQRGKKGLSERKVQWGREGGEGDRDGEGGEQRLGV